MLPDAKQYLMADPLSWIHGQHLNQPDGEIQGVARGIMNSWICREYSLSLADEASNDSPLVKLILKNWFVLPEIAHCLVVYRYRGAIARYPHLILSENVRSFMALKLSPEVKGYTQALDVLPLDKLSGLEMRALAPHLPSKVNALLEMVFPGHLTESCGNTPVFNEFIFFMAIQHVQRNTKIVSAKFN